MGRDEFWDEYDLCQRGIRPGVGRVEEKSQGHLMNDLVLIYFASYAFKSLATSSQKNYRRTINNFLDEYGRFLVTAFTPPLVRMIMEDKASAPTQANLLKKRLRALFKLARFLEWMDTDPLKDVDNLKYVRIGHHTWTEKEIKTFEDHYPSGSKARLAFTLLLYTGVRRSDLIGLGRQHIEYGKIRVRAVKNGTLIHLPIHKKLQREIDQIPDGQMQFVLTSYGKPFTADGYGNKMREWCDDAGLPDCASHGLRKAIAVRLYEAGASREAIGAVLGDKNLATVDIYIEDSKTEKLAADSFALLKPKSD